MADNNFDSKNESSKSPEEKLIVNPSWCKGCSICVKYCPTKTLKIENDKVKIVDINKCIECGLCELRCPDYAIYLRGKKNEK